ncbi:MAG: alpha/beta fold hydrolase, partial [Bacteroidetes bacterium]
MELAHKTLGQGPALLILHGLFGSLDNWLTLARQFGEHFSVYIIDQRNHGKSPWDERWDYAVMAEDLADFMDQQGIPQAYILGHSMGGKTAMQFAAEYPDRITRLIVADIAPKTYPPHHDLILETLNETPLAGLQSRQEAEAFMQSRISEPAVRQFLLKGLARDS